MPTVLILDDQLLSRMVLEELIRSIDHKLELATFDKPAKALSWARQNTPDLVLTDFKMPVMNGLEFIQWLRRIPACAEIPAVIITAVEDKDVRYRALEAGATDFLNKPIDHHECRARCRNLLKLREQQKIISDRAQWLEREVALKTHELRAREKETLLHLAKAGEYRHEATAAHVHRMAISARLIAEAMGQSADYCDTIEQAAPLHDIGKIGVPDHILHKPGPLTEAERGAMRHHPRIGYEILKDSSSKYLQMGADISWSHHERFDGGGYPRGLKGTVIPLEARIVAVADVFDALLTQRSYKPAWSLEQTLAHLRDESGGHFDPDCVQALEKSLKRILAAHELYPDQPAQSTRDLSPIASQMA